MQPLISIIIPTYNYAGFIKDAVESVLQQDYPKEKIEIIVVDDGSSDNTKDVLQEFINAGIVKYFYQDNEGKASATYKAIQQSNGKYIFNLDADDYFLEGKLKKTVEIFETDESIVHVATPAQIFEQETKKIKGNECLPKKILCVKSDGDKLLDYFYSNNILYGGGSTFSAKASVLKKINIPVAVDMYIDEFLLLTVLKYGKSFFIENPLSVWRVHTLNYSGATKNNSDQKTKGLRLLESSAAVLDYLQQNNFDNRLIKIYKLKHINRQIAYKESEHTKSLDDIFHYAKELIIDVHPSLKLIRKYQVLNRLLPLSIYHFLKQSKRGSLA